jgi:hypothetical protein
MENQPLLVSGITLQKPADKNSYGSITDIDVGISFDETGNLVFRDKFVSDYLEKSSVSLAEIYNRNKAVTYKDGKIYFKDSSLQREYSLEEIVNTCSQWKRNLIAGSLWWVGRAETDHRSCANLPKTSSSTDTNNVYWSVDKYISETTGLSICDPLRSVSFYEKTVNPETGSWKWYDIQNLEIVIPPIEDTNKLAILIAKLSYTQKNGSEPIVFRIYDATIGKELARSSVVNNGSDYSSYPVTLMYFGSLDTAKFTEINLVKDNPEKIVCTTKEDCGCVDTTCVEGETECINPNISYVDKKYATNSHLIKVQFHISNFHRNFWDRYFGVDLDNSAASMSSINAMIFDSSPANKYVHKHGTATFNNKEYVDILFATPLDTTSYAITLSPNKNINVWFSNKTKTGFRINAELAFQGYVDWTLININ